MKACLERAGASPGAYYIRTINIVKTRPTPYPISAKREDGPHRSKKAERTVSHRRKGNTHATRFSYSSVPGHGFCRRRLALRERPDESGFRPAVLCHRAQTHELASERHANCVHHQRTSTGNEGRVCRQLSQLQPELSPSRC